MIMSIKTLKLATLAFTAAGLLGILGCSDESGLAKRYAVSGTVNYNGTPVAKGTITFVPNAADGRSAAGEIADGYYTLTTAEKGDGALPGSYKVTIMSKEVDTTKLQEVAKGGQFHHDKDFAKAVKTAKSLVPARYGLADTSGLTAEVKAESNKIPFDLKD